MAGTNKPFDIIGIQRKGALTEMPTLFTDFGRSGSVQARLSSFCDDINYTAHPPTPVENGLVAVADFDLRDIFNWNQGGVELTIVCGIHRHTVKQQNYMTRTKTTDVDPSHAVVTDSRIEAR